MEKSVIEKVLGKVKHITKDVVETANGEKIRIKKAVALTADTFIFKYKVLA